MEAVFFDGAVNSLVAIVDRSSPPYSRLLRELRVRMLEAVGSRGGRVCVS